MQSVFNKRKAELLEFNNALEELNIRKRERIINPKPIPSDLMVKCPSCSRFILKDDLLLGLNVCPLCNYHTRLGARDRLNQIMDLGYKELFTGLPQDYLDFPEYKQKLNAAIETTGNDESVVCVSGKINGIKALVAVMDSKFMMGSMGSVCGEKITLLAEMALKKHLPLIIFTCSGGARMQEGIISLFQMAKTSQAIAKLREKELYIAVLTDPTTGGVSASFASLADITLAEPGALIGFAGKRVIEKTINETLPDNFQTAEFLIEKGFLDKIVDRKDMKDTLSLLLKLHNYK
ncbi:MAG: acetyl-CoA carboxylase, carboxyltransferase subunit beta [Anaeroplasma sp.]